MVWRGMASTQLLWSKETFDFTPLSGQIVLGLENKK